MVSLSSFQRPSRTKTTHPPGMTIARAHNSTDNMYHLNHAYRSTHDYPKPNPSPLSPDTSAFINLAHNPNNVTVSVAA